MASIQNKGNFVERKYSKLYRLEYKTYSVNTDKPELKIFNFQLLESIDYSTKQGIISYETVGGNGGLVLNTGRRTETLQLAGKLFSEYIIRYSGGSSTDVEVTNAKNFNDVKRELLNIKDNGASVELFGHPFLYFEKREWIITDINFGLGTAHDYLTFTINLIENRQANVETTSINLVNSGNKLEFMARLKASIVSSG